MPPRALREDPVGRFLPLKPVWFHIVLSLLEQPSHGYAIRQAVHARTEGKIQLWPATLYGSLSEIEQAGLIEEWQPAGAQDDVDRRSYKLTTLGRRVLAAETERLETLVRLARAALRGRGST
jgi:DNA-binding PadR family transcriptional regulator